MSNNYNFDDGDLQLSADKVEQFTAALATGEIADPLQELCDEAAAAVARLTAGYLLDDISIFSFLRAIAIYNAYANSGSPVPPDVQNRYDQTMDELTAIAQGKRPNLAKVSDPAQATIAGGWGSEHRLYGRLQR